MRSSTAGIDTGALARWLDDRLGDAVPISDVRMLTGGTQNVLVSLGRGDRRLVVRLPAATNRGGARMIEREAAVLELLRGTDVPHAELIGAELDPGVLGSAFYVMDEVDGVNPTEDCPPSLRDDPAIQRALGFSMVDAIARLSRVDPAGIGAQKLARAEGWLERQVPRWTAMLDDHERAEGAPPFDVETVTAVREWLERHTPPESRTGLLHGDFHFGNVMIDPHDGRVVAVIDWELSTVGDPLLDLGHLLLTWPLAPRAEGEDRLDLPGLPSRREVIERYEEVAQRSCEHADWFEVLAGYRLAIILAGTRARAMSGLADPAVGDRLHRLAVHHLGRVRSLTTGATHG